MSGLGTQHVTGQRWRNPASPDVLRALPWEFGDGDVFISSAPSPTLGPLESSQSALRYLDPTWTDRRSSSLASGLGEVQTGPRSGAVTSVSISAGMTRSASSSGTPVLPPQSPVEAPAYLIAKPSTLPAVFVRDSPEYLRSQAEIAATLGSGETMKRPPRVSSAISSSPTLSSINKRGARQSQLGQPPSSPYEQTASPTARASKDTIDVAETGGGRYDVAMSSSSRRESFASPAISPGSSRGGVLAPSRAKSTPEFASRVRFKLDEKNPPALPATVRVRGSRGGGVASSSESTAPLSYSVPGGRRNSHRMNGPSGPLVLSPLDILSTSSLASAAEDIISSASASARYHAEEERRKHQGSIAGASTSSCIAEMPPLLERPAKRSKQRLRNMDSAAMKQHAIAKNQRKKNPQYVV